MSNQQDTYVDKQRKYSFIILFITTAILLFAWVFLAEDVYNNWLVNDGGMERDMETQQQQKKPLLLTPIISYFLLVEVISIVFLIKNKRLWNDLNTKRKSLIEIVTMSFILTMVPVILVTRLYADCIEDTNTMATFYVMLVTLIIGVLLLKYKYFKSTFGKLW